MRTEEGVMIYPGEMLIDLFGRNASPKIVRNLGGITYKSMPSKLLIDMFLDFARDPYSRATLWKESSWKDFNRNDCLAKLRLVGIAIVDVTLKMCNVNQIRIRRFNTLPKLLMLNLNTTKKFDIEKFARSIHNVFVHDNVDVEMVTPDTSESSTRTSTSSSSSDNILNPSVRQITCNRDECVGYLGTLNIKWKGMIQF